MANAFSRVSARPPSDTAQPEPSGTFSGFVNKTADNPQHQANKKQVQNGFLEEAVREDGRSVECKTEPGDQPSPLRIETASRECQQHACCRADHGLADAHHQKTVPRDRVDGSQKIRIERRLVKHVLANPVAGRDLHGPRVVSTRVAHQHVKERRLADLPDVDEADRKPMMQSIRRFR